jgi:hypothetical protein
MSMPIAVEYIVSDLARCLDLYSEDGALDPVSWSGRPRGLLTNRLVGFNDLALLGRRAKPEGASPFLERLHG